MKKQILNLGKALDKAEQKSVNGGFRPGCTPNVHISACQGLDDAANGIIFYPYLEGPNQTNTSDYGECCVFPT